MRNFDLDPDAIPLDKRVRRICNFDMRPAGFDGIGAVDQLKAAGVHIISERQMLEAGSDCEKIMMMAMMLNVIINHQGVLKNPVSISTLPSVKMNTVTQSMCEAARLLIIYNINKNVTEEGLSEFIRNMMTTYRCLSGTSNPILSVKIDQQKSRALIEFRTPEEATNALAFDGVMLKSRPIRIYRPHTFIPIPLTPIEPPSINIAGIISSYVPSTANRIIIGNIPIETSREQMIQILTAFGDLRSFKFTYDLETNERTGHAFCEYVDAVSLSDLVVDALNDLSLETNRLLVQRSNKGTIRIDISALLPTTIPKTIMGTIATSVEPTPIVQLLNMLTLEDIESDLDYQKIKNSIYKECSNFGSIVRLIIPRPKDDNYQPGIGRIYIKYQTVESAIKAVT